MPNSPVPAAQYLRMSTDLQQYSLDNQAAAIARYAEDHGLAVVKTYADPAKSGLALRDRPGLRQLLNDVVNGVGGFKAILVYDVSRWGRFQDMDESAHYEYLCKAAGRPVVYCAEGFSDDMAGLIMKALKRTMAGEFSRELSVKVLAGQRRLASMGFRQGSWPGYGLRRMLLTAGTTPKQLLADGEHKCLSTDRVKLVPGPEEEVAVVREMFRMLIEDGNTVHGIVRELNRRRILPAHGARWHDTGVYKLLSNPKYAGCLLYGRTSQRLLSPSVNLPREQWLVVPDAYEPIVSKETFAKAQEVLENRTFHRSNERLLEDLRRLWREKQHLSSRLIDTCPYTPSVNAYELRFGTLQRAYDLIGFVSPRNGKDMVRHKAINKALRQQLLANIVTLFPKDVELVEGKTKRYRTRLRLRDRSLVSVLVARSLRLANGELRWAVAPVEKERNCITLLARLNADNSGFCDYHLMPFMDRKAVFFLRESDAWLRAGLKLASLPRFLSSVSKMRRRLSNS